MKVGFTGTRHGMTQPQLERFIAGAIKLGHLEEFHHGNCVGADTQAHRLFQSWGIKVIIHPPDNVKNRAFNRGCALRDPLPYGVRDHNIVDETNLLLAAPATMVEIVRSGTWATIRYARKLNRPIIIVWPDGTITKENCND